VAPTLLFVFNVVGIQTELQAGAVSLAKSDDCAVRIVRQRLAAWR
jgi:hypothetical protein